MTRLSGPRRAALALAATIGLLAPSAALAQPYFPPHIPGTICATPYGWCWLPRQSYLGSPCFCPGPFGQQVQGAAS